MQRDSVRVIFGSTRVTFVSIRVTFVSIQVTFGSIRVTFGPTAAVSPAIGGTLRNRSRRNSCAAPLRAASLQAASRYRNSRCRPQAVSRMPVTAFAAEQPLPAYRHEPSRDCGNRTWCWNGVTHREGLGAAGPGPPVRDNVKCGRRIIVNSCLVLTENLVVRTSVSRFPRCRVRENGDIRRRSKEAFCSLVVFHRARHKGAALPIPIPTEHMPCPMNR
jgi:hypothetical protein